MLPRYSPPCFVLLSRRWPRSVAGSWSPARSMSPPTAASGWSQLRERFFNGTLAFGGAAGRSTEPSGDDAAALSPPLVGQVRQPSWGESLAAFAEKSLGRKAGAGSDGAAALSPSDSSSKNEVWRALIRDMEERRPEQAGPFEHL